MIWHHHAHWIGAACGIAIVDADKLFPILDQITVLIPHAVGAAVALYGVWLRFGHHLPEIHRRFPQLPKPRRLRKMITPSIGRKVWFTPAKNYDGRTDRQQPYDATIVYVWDNRKVNLRVTDHHGHSEGVESVTLIQEGDLLPEDGRYCCWMPFQKGQAAITDKQRSALTEANSAPTPIRSMDETVLEADLRAKNLTAPRISPRDLDQAIAGFSYWVPPGTTTTVCCLTLRNGFTVVGHSACASPANFDAEIGRNLAYGAARQKIWELEGYLLREQLHKGESRG